MGLVVRNVAVANNTLAFMGSVETKRRATLTEWCKIIFKSLREIRLTDQALKSQKLKKSWILRHPFAFPATWKGKMGVDLQDLKEPAAGKPRLITVVKAGNETGLKEEDRLGSMIWALSPDKPWIWVELRLPKKIKLMVLEGSQGWSAVQFSNQILR